ncbi:MAG: SagB family peptide dehydrogenase [Acidobacteria bacterium]|nr:SagB family peptide dehydrogenase [Acidobacteriota bacterium]
MSFVDLVWEPAFHVRLGFGSTISRSEDGASFVLKNAHGSLPVGPYTPGFEAGNALLIEGAPLAGLRDAVLRSGGAHGAGAYMLWLQGLCDRLGVIEFALVDEAGECAVILPQWEAFVPALAPQAPAEEVRLDRFACLRREGEAWLLESPLAGCRFGLDELGALDTPLVRRALDASGFLASTGGETGPRRRALAQWEFHDLLFHMRHRRGWHRDSFGAAYPFIGEIEPLPAARPSWSGERIALDRAPDAAGAEPFASVLERRRSERVYDLSRPLGLRDLGALLDRAARIRSFDSFPVANWLGHSTRFEVTRRPYPNGGASYELEIYPVVDRCNGLASGLYHYDAEAHALVRISGRTSAVEALVAGARIATVGEADPQVVLAIAARFARVTWKYRSIAYAVILRNAGVLYQTLYLAATELGLSPCGIGSGDAAVFARATGLDPVIEGTVGDFILGGPPRR